MRVQGNIAFNGVLRVQGDVLGDVSCDTDANGTLVVDSSGNVAGTIKAPHVIVKGHALGPVHSSQSIHIRQGGRLVGDAFYNEIEMRPGGVIEGSLISSPSAAGSKLTQEHRSPILKPPAKPYDARVDNGSRLASPARLGAVSVLVLSVLAVLWASRKPTAVTPPDVDVVLKTDSAMARDSVAPQAASVDIGAPTGVQRAGTGDTVPAMSSSIGETKGLVQTSPPDHPEIAPEEVVTVQGVNPRKPTGVFLVISREPSVLLRKKREDAGDGKRIEVSQGGKITIALERDEIFRVVKGRGLEIIYQGRQVAPRTIESGAWINFVPHSASKTGDDG